MEMDPICLRAILHERIHHTIEVFLYRILKKKIPHPKDFGEVGAYLLDIWKRRGLPIDAPDLKWCVNHIGLARMIKDGGTIELDTKIPEPFNEQELETVDKLIFQRRSIRQFEDKPVDDEMIRKILMAGHYAPHGCNVGCTRFLVLRKPEEWKLVRSDIPVENCVMIVILQEVQLSIRAIADRYEMSERSAYRWLKYAEADGWDVIKRGCNPTLYQLAVPRCQTA